MRQAKLSARTQRNVEWIQTHLKIPEGHLVGQPVKLSPAQIGWMEMIYGSPTRLFICSLPRKNGKTSFSAMLVLLHLVGPEAVENGQLYSAAQSRDQASILHSLATKMVRMSPELSSYVAVRESAKQLICAELGTVYKALSADASTAYGLSPSFAVHDELGQVKGPRSELYEAIETASAAQANPLSVVISTQASTDADLLSLLIDDALKGDDPRVKCVLHSVPEDADPFDREVLAKAQPNWHLMNHAEVFSQAETAKRMPSREASFRNLVANQRVNLTNPFVSRGVWEANAGAPDFTAFDKAEVFVGLDLSARHDLTAAVAVCKFEGKWHVWPHFFAPQHALAERSRRDRVPYDVWAEKGHLNLVPGPTVDLEFMARWLADFCADHNVRSVRYDRWRMDVLKAELARMGVELPLAEFGQGYKDMTPALDILEGELVEGNVLHGLHPVLTMCAANAVAVRDPAGGRKLDKSKATGRIDGMVSLAMAMGAAGASLQVEKKPLTMFML